MNERRNTLVLIVIAVVAVVVVGAVIFSGGSETVEEGWFDEFAALERGEIDGRPYLGSLDAPVTMLIYEDFGCPNCKAFYENTEPFVLEEFVATGKVRIEIYFIAIVNNQSLPGGEAAMCAQEQDMFWQLRVFLYENQTTQRFNRENLVAMAGDAGLDASAFANCYDSARYSRTVVEQSQVAFDFGITGTPTSDINGERLVGVYPFISDDPTLISVKDVIDTALLDVQE